jgi:hypothetical protein
LALRTLYGKTCDTDALSPIFPAPASSLRMVFQDFDPNSMHNHKLPSGLTSLIESGVWPTEIPNMQERRPLLGKKAAHALSADDDRIVLMAPPFHTIADEVRGGNYFWTSGLTNVGEIDYENALIIADFGLGSDSPIILYFGNSQCPSVKYLRWTGNGDNIRHEWIETHTSFDDFVVAVGLDQIQR